MAPELAVVVIHGMGSHTPGYSNGLIEELKRRIGVAASDRTHFAEVLWADITERQQTRYINAVGALSWMHRFVVHALGDASAYQRVYEPSSIAEYEEARKYGTYFRIHERLAHKFSKVSDAVDPEAKLVVLAHSLGGHIFSNYYWDIQKQQPDHLLAPELRGALTKFERMDALVGLVTFGCNIPLFTFALEDIKPISFPPAPIRQSSKWRPRAKWLNFYDPDDILGYPLKPINPAYRQVVNEDIEIEVGPWGAGATPASHTMYWTDNDFTKRVASLINTMLA